MYDWDNKGGEGEFSLDIKQHFVLFCELWDCFPLGTSPVSYLQPPWIIGAYLGDQVQLLFVPPLWKFFFF